MTKKIKTVSFESLDSLFDIIESSKDDSWYTFQIQTAYSYNARTWVRSRSYDYFSLDNDGVIKSSPRWFAKKYNWLTCTDIKIGTKSRLA